jgi:hypothetical protein
VLTAFLSETSPNDHLDFHSLRHTTGAWLALQGVHPNVIKTVMRHSTIVLTMDTYGHLLPDQQAETLVAMAPTLEISPMRAAVGVAVDVRTEPQGGANECDAVRNALTDNDSSADRKSLRIANVCETVLDDATGRGGIRTHTGIAPQGILSPQCLPFHHAAAVGAF